jgi:hypothetical protein
MDQSAKTFDREALLPDFDLGQIRKTVADLMSALQSLWGVVSRRARWRSLVGNRADICVDEVVEVTFELLMAIVVVSLDSGFFDGPVHSLNLAVSPRVPDLG